MKSAGSIGAVCRREGGRRLFSGEHAETLGFQEVCITSQRLAGLQVTIRKWLIGLFSRFGLLDNTDGEALIAGLIGVDVRLGARGNEAAASMRSPFPCPGFAMFRRGLLHPVRWVVDGRLSDSICI